MSTFGERIGPNIFTLVKELDKLFLKKSDSDSQFRKKRREDEDFYKY